LKSFGGKYNIIINSNSSYNNLIPIEYLPSNTDFFLFKDYIKPEWEDIKNKKGGRWIYDIAWDKSKHHLISQHTEQVWLKLVKEIFKLIIFLNKMLSLIGNQFEESEYFICGIVLSIRHYNNKISIWTSNSKDEETILNIG
jgi:translation initiation factor 4E